MQEKKYIAYIVEGVGYRGAGINTKSEYRNPKPILRPAGFGGQANSNYQNTNYRNKTGHEKTQEARI
jgi:hypothetical protein